MGNKDQTEQLDSAVIEFETYKDVHRSTESDQMNMQKGTSQGVLVEVPLCPCFHSSLAWPSPAFERPQQQSGTMDEPGSA